MMEIGAGDYRLVAAPERGGSILRFDWRGEPLMRPAAGSSILDVACFPLVPFCNRIAHGRFRAGCRDVRLRPNFPGLDHPHPLHGFGWLTPWTVTDCDETALTMTQVQSVGEWPWAYRAEQRLILTADGLTMTLAATNLSNEPMPLGLGFHPYFPRDETTLYHGFHRGEWSNDAECLPVAHDQHSGARDWWNGRPVGTRAIDTVYTDRSGPLEITWPTRSLRLVLTPGAELAHTAVYSPQDATFFCVEPVTNQTDAFNRGRTDLLPPGETRSVELRLTAGRL